MNVKRLNVKKKKVERWEAFEYPFIHGSQWFINKC